MDSHNTPQFGQSTLQVLNSHQWLEGTIMESTDLEDPISE